MAPGAESVSYILYNRLSDTISSVYDTFRHYIENATPFSPEVAAASALESDTIRLEKHKLARVQQLERRWLQSALGAELESRRAAEDPFRVRGGAVDSLQLGRFTLFFARSATQSEFQRPAHCFRLCLRRFQ